MSSIYKVTSDTIHRDFSVEKVEHIPFPFSRNLPVRILNAEHIVVVYVVAPTTHEADALSQIILSNYINCPEIPYKACQKYQ